MTKPIRVHRNLHAARQDKPQWVETKSGRVSRYHRSITLVDVSTRIQPAGQRKCAESGVRAVCAFLDGVAVSTYRVLKPNRDGWVRDWLRLSYDPRVDTAFMAGGERFNRADAVHMNEDGSAFVLNPSWED